MAKKKNPYKILGIEENAPKEDVKKAFRELAKKMHPDVNKSPDAEESFKEINEAYNNIINGNIEKEIPFQSPFENDPELEEMINRYRAGFNSFNFNGFKRQRNFNPDITESLTIEFMEACNGISRNIEFNRVDKCPSCEKNASKNTKVCDTCNGKGMKVFKRGNTVISTTCDKCFGSGKIIDCNECNGEGFKRNKIKIDLKIPKGIDNGMILKILGMGNFVNGKFGDLYVTINVKEHPLFKRDGINIFTDINVPYIDCLLGGEIDVETIYGMDKIKINECTKNNDIISLSDKGIEFNGAKGGHYFKICINMPTHLTEKERKILRRIKGKNK